MTTDTNSQARTGNDIYERVTNQIIAAIEVGAGEYLIHVNGLGVQRGNHLDRCANRQVLE